MSTDVVDVKAAISVETGASAPLGAPVRPGGVNFSVFPRSATPIELLLFDGPTAEQPSAIVPLEARGHRTYHYWHAFVPGLESDQLYGYRAQGPFDPERGAIPERDDRMVSALATRLLGSPDLYGHEEREAEQSINFVRAEGRSGDRSDDAEINCLDWTLLERHADVHRFAKELNLFRQRRDVVVKAIGLSLNQLLDGEPLTFEIPPALAVSAPGA